MNHAAFVLLFYINFRRFSFSQQQDVYKIVYIRANTSLAILVVKVYINHGNVQLNSSDAAVLNCAVVLVSIILRVCIVWI